MTFILRPGPENDQNLAGNETLVVENDTLEKHELFIKYYGKYLLHSFIHNKSNLLKH